ncbi:hypothetical protein MNBD_GAMMA11-3449 [hydrothermal vent metagenome]|uniref:ORC1/DEAH AAA+ ATPase domain-containing protein n=1 Tax=hydrothermal vent metagenome TaxID=652676 RepID=A0A3B0YB33_9ZZZZ
MIRLPETIQKIDIQIPHRNWDIALSESFSLLIASQPGDVVCITGPSRAGKSRLIEELRKLLSAGVNYKQTGLIPVVVVEAANTGPHGSFSTKALTQRMIDAVKHPIFSLQGDDLYDSLVYQKLNRATEGELRFALERAFVARQTRYLFIDEAQHAKYAYSRSESGHAVIDSWKCLAQTSELVLVVVGAYPILEVLQNSPHLLGRKHQVHLPRYHYNESDMEAFYWILAHYDRVVTLHAKLKTLQDCAQLLYDGSLGCIGLLRGWLTRASAISAMYNTGVTREILKDTRISKSDLNEILKEIIIGEKNLDTEDFIKTSIGHSYKTSQENKSSHKPFQRKPKRYKKKNRTEVDNSELVGIITGE